jgi:hypothetical protein
MIHSEVIQRQLRRVEVEEGKYSQKRKFMTFMTLSKLMNHAVLSNEKRETGGVLR